MTQGGHVALRMLMASYAVLLLCYKTAILTYS